MGDGSFFRAGARPTIPTGNLIVKFKRGVSTTNAVEALRRGNGQIATSGDFTASDFSSATALVDAEALVLEKIGAAVIHVDQAEGASVRMNSLAELDEIGIVVPEFYVFTSDDPHADDAEATWGIRAVGADRSPFTGLQVKIAILDTGFDIGHPDFMGREIKTWSAIEGESAGIDHQGHGTHCVGTAAGPDVTAAAPRYGIAHQADIHVYKVLNNGGTGTDGAVLTGIERAILDGCEIISMSFGRSAQLDSGPNQVYEQVAHDALGEGCLMIAAAGNSSTRDLGYIAPIEYPANSPSIMAIAAVDSRHQVGNFSSGAANSATEIALVAPGAGILSSFPMPRRYKRDRGTSMAAPHAAGVACLWAQKDAKLRGRKLWQALTKGALALPFPSRDVGAGLVQAPGA